MPDASLGSLLAKIGLDTSELKKGVDESHGLMGGMQGAAKGVALGVAGIATAAVAFGAESAHTFADVGGEVIKLQRYTGESAESMSRLRFAAEESGVGTDDLAKSMGLLSKKIEAGKDGLDKYGVATKDAHGKTRPLNDILLDTANVFEKMPNGVEKNALAMQLFGKAGMGMVPFLNRGKEGLHDLEGEADKFGLTLSQNNVDAVKKSIAAHREFHAAMQGLQVQIGQYVLPVLTSFTTHMVSVLVPAIGFVHNAMGPVVDVIGQFWGILTKGDFKGGVLAEDSPLVDTAFKIRDAIGSVIQGVKDFISGFTKGTDELGSAQSKWAVFGALLYEKVMPVIREIAGFIADHWKPILIGIGIAVAALFAPFTTLAAILIYIYARFKVVREVIADFIAGVKIVASAISEWVKDSQGTWDQWGKGISDVLERVVAIFREVFIIVGAVVYVAIELLIGLWDRFGSHLLDHLKTAFNALVQVFKGVFEVFHGVFDLFADLFTGKWGKLWGDVKTIFKGLWDLIVGVLKLALDVISTAIGLAMAAISELWHYAWEGIKAGLSAVWDAIKYVVSSALGWVKDYINMQLQALQWVWNTVWTGIKDALGWVWDQIKRAVSDAVGVVRWVITNEINAMAAVWHGVWGGIRDITAWTWGLLTGWVSAGVGFVKAVVRDEINGMAAVWHGVWGGIRDITQWTWGLLTGWVGGGIQWIRDTIAWSVGWISGVWGGAWGGIRDTVWNIWEAIKGIVRGGINFVIDGINAMLRAIGSVHIDIPKVHIPGTNTDIGGGSIGMPGMPQIPRFHSGGIVPGPTNQEILAVLRGGEQVIANPSQAPAPSAGSGPAPAPVTYDLDVTINAQGSPQELGAAAASELDWLMATRS